MSVRIGDQFDNFVVVRTAKEAIDRWNLYHETRCLYNIMAEGLEKNILGACLEDEYKEIEKDQYMMGVGLWAYNEARRRA